MRTAIGTAAAAQQAVITGVAADKQAARTALTNELFAVAATLAAYAADAANRELYNASYFPASDLRRLTDEKLLATASLVADNATANLSNMANYGLTADKVATLSAANAAFAAALATPRWAIVVRKNNHRELAALTAQAMTLLKEHIDNAVNSLIFAQPVMAKEYRSARHLVNVGHRHTALRGVVTDAATGMRIVKATVTIVELNRTATTGTDGVYGITAFKSGIYTVLVKADGYADITINNVEFKLGKSTELMIELSKMTMQLSKAA